MEDLVNYAKTNVDKFEKRILDTKAEIEKSKVEKRKEEDTIKNRYLYFKELTLILVRKS